MRVIDFDGNHSNSNLLHWLHPDYKRALNEGNNIIIAASLLLMVYGFCEALLVEIYMGGFPQNWQRNVLKAREKPF